MQELGWVDLHPDDLYDNLDDDWLDDPKDIDFVVSPKRRKHTEHACAMDKKQLRMIRNRESARASRERKAETLRQLEAENEYLRKRIAELEQRLGE